MGAKSWFRSRNPKKRLTDRKRVLKFRDGRVGFKSLPEFGVLRPVVCPGCKQQARRPNGKVLKVSRISSIRPGAAIANVGIEPRDHGAHPWPVLKLELPDALETGGEQNADPGEHVEIEERVAIGVRRGEFMGKRAISSNLSAYGAGLELMAESGEWRVISNLGEMGDRSSLEEPRGAVLALVVARKAGQTRAVEPVEVLCKPFLQGGKILLGERFRIGKKGNTLNDFREMYGFNDTFRAA